MFVGVTAEKLVGGLFAGGTEFNQNFHKGKKFRREKVFVGENFCHLANISSLFPTEKFFLRYNENI